MFRTFFFLCLTALLIAGGYAWFQRVELAEKFLSKKLHSEVHLKNVTFGPTHLTLHHVRIKNRALAHPIRVKTLKIEVKPWELLKDTIAIDALELDHPTVPVELLALPLTKSPSDRQFTIEQVKIKHMHLVVPDVLKIDLPVIPLIELHHIGSAHSLSLEQVGSEIFGSIYGQLKGEASYNKVLPARTSFYERSKMEVKKATKKTTQFFKKLFSK